MVDVTRALALALASVLLCACTMQTTAPPPSPEPHSGSIAWGPQIGTSSLSVVSGADRDFGPEVSEALARAARVTPNGASQSSLARNGKTAGEIVVDVIRNEDGNLVYAVTDQNMVLARAPGPPDQDVVLSLFADVPAGIQPDPSSYPHELLGIWAWGDEAGTFWTASPSIPAAFDNRTRTGRMRYQGDAVGLRAAGKTVTKFLARITLIADFDRHTVSGRIDGFRSFQGRALDSLPVRLAETGFSPGGQPFSGKTSAGMGGGGQWGARWSDAEGWALGGTFGFASDNGTVTFLGSFNARSRDPVPTARQTRLQP